MKKTIAPVLVAAASIATGVTVTVAGGRLVTDDVPWPDIDTSRSRVAALALPIDWPLCEGTEAGFGWYRDPLTGVRAFHTGLDLRGELGTEVGASASGIVVFAERNGAYGLTLKIDHGAGLQTQYSQLRSVLVSPGDHVEAGQKIAHVGSSARASHPHLHFEVRIDGRIYDPALYLFQNDKCSAMRSPK